MSDEDDGYQSPTFDLSSDDSDDDGATMYNPNKAMPSSKKKRRTEERTQTLPEFDLEAMALKALGKR